MYLASEIFFAQSQLVSVQAQVSVFASLKECFQVRQVILEYFVVDQDITGDDLNPSQILQCFHFFLIYLRRNVQTLGHAQVFVAPQRCPECREISGFRIENTLEKPSDASATVCFRQTRQDI